MNEGITITCKQCGYKVGNNDESCPKCGALISANLKMETSEPAMSQTELAIQRYKESRRKQQEERDRAAQAERHRAEDEAAQRKAEQQREETKRREVEAEKKRLAEIAERSKEEARKRDERETHVSTTQSSTNSRTYTGTSIYTGNTQPVTRTYTGNNTYGNTNNHVNGTKNKVISILLCIFLGVWGGHRFYEGKYITAIIYALTSGLFGIGILVDLICLIGKPTYYTP